MNFIINTFSKTFFIMLFSALLLQGCVHRPVASPSCLMMCKVKMNDCVKTCHNNCQACNVSACQSTAKNYHKYTHEQIVKGGFIARDLNSYHDPLQCRKVTCNCPSDYNICIQACSGVIHKCLQVAPTC